MAVHVINEARRCLQCKKPLCRVKGCPVQTNVPEMIRLFLDGKINEAGAMLYDNNPMSVFCSLVCDHDAQCEGNCIQGRRGAPIQISSIEHYISDTYLDKLVLTRKSYNGHNVAVIGAGPAGIVVAVGEGVSSVKPGDHVIPLYTAECGECEMCTSGKTNLCSAVRATQGKGLMPDGTVRFFKDGQPVYHYMGCSTFSEYTVVAEVSLAKIQPEADLREVCLLGCGVTAGLGAVLNTGELKRGESVAVIGCGGVGTAAIAGAQLGGATTIIAVDIDEEKLARAREHGATHTVNSSKVDPVEAIKELTGGFGADLVIDAVGIAPTFKQAFEARDLAGRVVLVGVPAPGTTWDIPLDEVFGRGGSIKSAWYGDTLPSRDFPEFVDQYLRGRLDLDGFVSERIHLEDINEAFETMKTGRVLRSVVEL